MFGLFRRRPRTARTTLVWRDSRARLAGLAAEAGEPARRRPLLVALRDAAALDACAHALGLPREAVVDDGYALADVLARDGGGPWLTRVDGLLRRAPPAGRAGPEVHVVGVAARAQDDDRLLEALAWADGVTFHCALDDPLLARTAPSLAALVDRLGLDPAVPIEGPPVDAAIRRAQRAR